MKRFCFSRSRKNLDRSRIEANEKALLDVVKTVKLMVNPFDNEHEDLVHLASGTVASSAVSDDMKTTLEKGENAAINFTKTNIVGEAPNITRMLLIAKSRNLHRGCSEVFSQTISQFPRGNRW